MTQEAATDGSQMQGLVDSPMRPKIMATSTERWLCTPRTSSTTSSDFPRENIWLDTAAVADQLS